MRKERLPLRPRPRENSSAVRTVALTREGEFNLLSGDVKTYVKVAESGARRLQAFCPECGSPLYATSESDGPKVYSIRIGTSRQRDKLVPRAQIWCRSAQGWVGDLGTIQKVDTQ